MAEDSPATTNTTDVVAVDAKEDEKVKEEESNKAAADELVVKEEGSDEPKEESTNDPTQLEEETPELQTEEVVDKKHLKDSQEQPQQVVAVEADTEKTKLEQDTIAMSLDVDVAYQSLESVRRLNVQVEFGCEVDKNQCIPCLRLEKLKEKQQQQMGGVQDDDSLLEPNSTSARFQKWRSSRQEKQRKQQQTTNTAPCLACGTPVCKQLHRSTEFAKQNNLVICNDCTVFFNPTRTIQQHFILNNHTNKDNALTAATSNSSPNSQRFNHILEVYDRALLILKYSMPYVEEVASSLEGNTSRHNKIGLASSTTGVGAGVLGVAAACTILTPVGPPLLLASIVFGGGATAVTAGSEAINYSAEPNKMADRILVLNELCTSIYSLPSILSMYVDPTTSTGTIAEPAALSPTSASSSSSTNASLHGTRMLMNGLKPLTAGALSAISIVTEAREMNKTISEIRAGNPCEKAERLRAIRLEEMPQTNDLLRQLELALVQYQELQKEMVAKQEKERKELMAKAQNGQIETSQADLLLQKQQEQQQQKQTSPMSSPTNDMAAVKKPLGWRFGRGQAASTEESSSSSPPAGNDDTPKRPLGWRFGRMMNNHNTTNGQPPQEAGQAEKPVQEEEKKDNTQQQQTPPAQAKQEFGWRIKRALNRDGALAASSDTAAATATTAPEVTPSEASTPQEQ